MKVIKFNELPIEEKQLLIKEFGQLVYRTTFFNCRAYLYLLSNQFIEVRYYFPVGYIVEASLLRYKELDKYLNHIIID